MSCVRVRYYYGRQGGLPGWCVYTSHNCTLLNWMPASHQTCVCRDYFSLLHRILRPSLSRSLSLGIDTAKTCITLRLCLCSAKSETEFGFSDGWASRHACTGAQSDGILGLNPHSRKINASGHAHVSQVRALVLVLQAHMERKDIVRAAMRSAANLIRMPSVVRRVVMYRRSTATRLKVRPPRGTEMRDEGYSLDIRSISKCNKICGCSKIQLVSTL